MTKLAPEWVRTSDPVIRSPARYRWTTAPASQQEEEASLGSASIFSASDHTDGSDNDISDHEHGKKQASTIEKWRFDPTGGKDEHSWHLLRGQDAFTTKYFSEYVGESAIKQSILKSCPEPSTDALKPRIGFGHS